MKTSAKDLFRSSGRTPELIAFRGLPGSGKTTAIASLKDRRPNVRVISMDDGCRAELGRLPQSESDEEVGRIRLRTLARYLLNAGEHVVVDDINLKDESLDHLAGIARSVSARFVVIDMWQEYKRQSAPVTPQPDLYDTWVELCIARDAGRARVADGRPEIGRDLIEGWGARYRDLFTGGTRHRATPLDVVIARED